MGEWKIQDLKCNNGQHGWNAKSWNCRESVVYRVGHRGRRCVMWWCYNIASKKDFHSSYHTVLHFSPMHANWWRVFRPRISVAASTDWFRSAFDAQLNVNYWQRAHQFLRSQFISSIISASVRLFFNFERHKHGEDHAYITTMTVVCRLRVNIGLMLNAWTDTRRQSTYCAILLQSPLVANALCRYLQQQMSERERERERERKKERGTRAKILNFCGALWRTLLNVYVSQSVY